MVNHLFISISIGSSMFIHFPHSMDWFKGKNTEKKHISWENPWFPGRCSLKPIHFPHRCWSTPTVNVGPRILSTPAVKASGTAAASSGDSSGAVTCAVAEMGDGWFFDMVFMMFNHEEKTGIRPWLGFVGGDILTGIMTPWRHPKSLNPGLLPGVCKGTMRTMT